MKTHGRRLETGRRGTRRRRWDLKFISISVLIFSICFVGNTTASVDGFVVWSEGSGCDRELNLSRIKSGVLGPRQTAVEKGPGADITVVISNDGKWIAFCRAVDDFLGRYGKCAERGSFEKFDIYIARIDGGLPAQPIRVGHGYRPTWGDDSHQPTKTLYFIHMSDRYSVQTVKKTTINANGLFSPPEQYAISPKKVSIAYLRMSPNGRYLAFHYRGINVWDVKEEKYVLNEGEGIGYQPCWGSRSQYLFYSARVSTIQSGKAKYLGRSGSLKYHFNVSNDAGYESGKLWFIARLGGSSHTDAGEIRFMEVDISDGGYTLKDSVTVGEGTSADIHIFSNAANTVGLGHINAIGHTPSIITHLEQTASELRLIIEPFSGGSEAGLYDILGNRKAHMPLSASSQNSMPLHGITDGKYILRIETGDQSMYKTLSVSRRISR